MELSLAYVAALAVALVCITAIKCFKIKYGDSEEIKKLSAQVDQLTANIKNVNAEAVKDLQDDVKALRNHYGLASRR